MCSSYSHDEATDKTVIKVEQGRPFLLRFKIKAWPIPTQVDLYKDGKKVKVSPAGGTIFVGLDRVGIQCVDRKSYGGKYTISAKNEEGEGKKAFQLVVKGMLHYQLVRV